VKERDLKVCEEAKREQVKNGSWASQIYMKELPNGSMTSQTGLIVVGPGYKVVEDLLLTFSRLLAL
jgi:hypothetical protein